MKKGALEGGGAFLRPLLNSVNLFVSLSSSHYSLSLSNYLTHSLYLSLFLSHSSCRTLAECLLLTIFYKQFVLVLEMVRHTVTGTRAPPPGRCRVSAASPTRRASTGSYPRRADNIRSTYSIHTGCSICCSLCPIFILNTVQYLDTKYWPPGTLSMVV